VHPKPSEAQGKISAQLPKRQLDQLWRLAERRDSTASREVREALRLHLRLAADDVDPEPPRAA
jgi:hypothetical protein